MPLKNYTTEVPADKSIHEIQVALVRVGATGVAYEFEPGGLVSGLSFRLRIAEQEVSFALPVNWRSHQAVLLKQHVRQARDNKVAYRVAWRNIRDWVLSQVTLYETSMVELPQVFLPFAMGRNGLTLYEAVKTNQFLLTNGDH